MPTAPTPVLRLGRQQMFFLVAQSAFRAGLTPKLEQVLAATHAKLELEAEEAARIAREAKTSIEGKEPRRFSKSRIMNAALHLAKVDGEIDDREIDILLKVGAIFGMPEPKVRAVIRSRLAGDDGMMLSTTEATIEEIEALARREAEDMAMEAAKTGAQPKTEAAELAELAEAPLAPQPTRAEGAAGEAASPEEAPLAPQPTRAEGAAGDAPPEADELPPQDPAPHVGLERSPSPAIELAEPSPAPPEAQPPDDEVSSSSPRSQAIARLRALPPKAIAGAVAGLVALGLLGTLGWNFHTARLAEQQAELLEKMTRDATKEILGHCRRGLDLAHEAKLGNARSSLDEAASSLTRSLDALRGEYRTQAKPVPKHLLAFPAAQIPAFRALVAAQELEQRTAHFQPLDVRIPHVEKIVAALDDSVSQLRALRRLDPEAEKEFKRVAAMHTTWSDALDALVMKRKNDRGF